MASFVESPASFSALQPVVRGGDSHAPRELAAVAASMLATAPPHAPATRPSHVPFQTAAHRVSRGRYITSKDPRGYIPVYEYLLNGQWIMMDVDDGYILWTGIWKALGHPKADIVKMIESLPELSSKLRRVRGGYLKIQGTWLPYEYAVTLARRVAWPIREDLVPFFGPSFPASCLSPTDPGYGRVLPPSNTRRKRRTSQAPDEWSVAASSSSLLQESAGSPSASHQVSDSHFDRRPSPLRIYTTSTQDASSQGRYSPYPRLAPSSTNTYFTPAHASSHVSSACIDDRRPWTGTTLSSSDSSVSVTTLSSRSSPVVSPLPFHNLNPQQRPDRPTLPSLSSLSLLPLKPLPPISSMAFRPDALHHDRRSTGPQHAAGIPDPTTVLRRLRLDDSQQRYQST